VLFGMAAGMSTVVRASAVGEEFALSHYGRVSGTLAMVTTFARALGPVAASVAYDVSPGYGYVFAGLAAVMLAAAGVAVAGPVTRLVAGAPVVVGQPDAAAPTAHRRAPVEAKGQPIEVGPLVDPALVIAGRVPRDHVRRAVLHDDDGG
jgi:MFS family permease